MADLVNSLYAPLVSTFMPAFIQTQDAYVYFTYSPLNNTDLIKKIHVSVVNQLTNENALDDLTGVLIYNTTKAGDINYDPASNMYYIKIPVNRLKNKVWNINQYYKVQLRLDSNTTNISENSSQKTKMSYLQSSGNQSYFSEWSSVCLLRPISQPRVTLHNLEVAGKETSIPHFNLGITPISGKVVFSNSKETETVQSYQIDVSPRDSNEVVYSTGLIYTGNLLSPNDINYKIDLQALDITNTTEFTLKLTITTKNQYTFSNKYYFDIAEFVDTTDFKPYGVNEDYTDKTLRVKVNNETGIATFRFLNDIAIYGTIYVKRSSSISGFKDWESILEQKVSDTLDITITDNTIGSHIWYRYSIQLENARGAMSQVYYSEIFFPEFYDAFLSRLDKQLDIKYDFKISSMKPIVNRAKIDTLGGKYPKFAENAVLNYKQFSISGTISAEADAYELFLKKTRYFGNDYNNYRVFLAQHADDITQIVRNDLPDYENEKFNTYIMTDDNNYFWEREFREEVLKWLNDGEPKLFRSMTEGLMPVMLTDISLTPKIELGRRLYDFSATMYEIAEGHSLQILDSLGIIDIPYVDEDHLNNPDVPTDMYRNVLTVGQLYEFYPTDNQNLVTTGAIYQQVVDKYKAGGIYTTREASELYIKDVQIFFNSEPHIFLVSTDGSLEYIGDTGKNLSPTQMAQYQANNQLQYGYTFTLITPQKPAGQVIFVNSRGYYQINDDIEVTGLLFNQYSRDNFIGDKVTVNYIVGYKERSTSGQNYTSQDIVKTIVGQFQDIFIPDVYMGEAIRNKYSYATANYLQQMQYWKGISVEFPPYSLIKLQYHDEDKMNEYLIGATGVLHLLKDTIVDDFLYCGLQVSEQPLSRQKYLAEHEFVITGIELEKTSDIKYPQMNNVYKVNGKDYIYYHNQWVPFENRGNGTGVVKADIGGTVNFLGTVIQVNL